MTGNTNQNKALEGRDANTGRFVSGNNGGGRPKGSRNKLTTEFIDDLRAEWQKSGPSALQRLAQDDPGAFVRVVAQILPKEIDANVNAGSDFDGMDSIAEILQKVANEVGTDAALSLAKAFGLEKITDAPEPVSVMSTVPKLGHSQRAIEDHQPANRPKRGNLAPR
jgi:hypothetical protein